MPVSTSDVKEPAVIWSILFNERQIEVMAIVRRLVPMGFVLGVMRIKFIQTGLRYTADS
jgi:Fe2+ transport system protein FeoA